MLTFGFTLLSSDIAIGRKTQKSAIGAYAEMRPKWKFLGILTFLVPVLIMTYYAVIGGWIVKPDYVIGEMERNGEHFRRRGVYTVMIRYIAPVIMFVLFCSRQAYCLEQNRQTFASAGFLRELGSFSFAQAHFMVY